MDVDKHVRYFQSCLEELPQPYTGLETSRLTVIYFSVVALDVLGQLDLVDRRRVVTYVKSMLITNIYAGEPVCGFIGSPFLGQQAFGGMCESGACAQPAAGCNDENCSSSSNSSISAEFLEGHLAMTYSAIAVLYTLGESLDELPKAAIIRQLSRLQNDDGGFGATENGSERDLRFLYCACSISSFLEDWSGVDVDRAAEYVTRCFSYDGGLALTPGGLEGQGGACYCGIASLSLMGKLDVLQASGKLPRLNLWLAQRVQCEGGYNGRVNKVPDSCYSFWVGGTAHILGVFDDTARAECRDFLLRECQNTCYGGFGKTPGDYSDVLHSFYSIAWLSLDAESECTGAYLRAIDPLSGVVKR
jgi:geranylgeranyl transferase type-1 subunit beta